MFYKVVVKRFLDIILSTLGIILLSPIFIILAILVRIKLGSPVIFSQRRPGYKEKIFKMYKFRSMTNETDEKGNLLPDEKRLNKFGKVLRSTSLDELPELINVFVGQMSIVGPRPLLPEYLERYNETQKRRHNVRPGITGLAQVNGRNAISWAEKLSFDVEYADNISFMLDIRILLKTIGKVFNREGINPDGEYIMPNFNEKGA